MGVFRSYSQKDTFITNKVLTNGIAATATGSNEGANPVLSVFADSYSTIGTQELGRILIQFDMSALSQSMFVNNTIPSSSVSYIMRMFDVTTGDTRPTSFDLVLYPLSATWDEGLGRDDINYEDGGTANWTQATSMINWVATGSDYLTGTVSASQHFDRGGEDLEVNVTSIVNAWLTGGLINNGLVIKLLDAQENSGNYYYRKAFSSRETQFISKMPYIEARWNDVFKDNRHNFALNVNSNLYMYNVIRGNPQNVSEPVTVRIQDGLLSSSQQFYVTASRAATGLYSASFNIPSLGISASWADIWYSGSTSYMTGAFQPLVLTGSSFNPKDEFDISMDHLKRTYSSSEQARIIVNVRKKNFITHVGPISTASLEFGLEREYIESAYYSVVDYNTGDTIISYGTGSIPYTQLSYDGEGNFFNMNMSNFVPGFVYQIKLLMTINNQTLTSDDENPFLFKVV